MKSTYSTAELAKMFDVNESTVKRWADRGHIECVKTRGGHRRFPVRSVLQLAYEHRLAISNLDMRLLEDGELRANIIAGRIEVLVPEMKTALLAGDGQSALRTMRIGLAAAPDLLRLYHGLLFPPLAQIGDAWARGELTVDVEHLASHAARYAVHQLESELRRKPSNGRTALLAAHEDDEHDLVVRCIAQYLTCEGWKTLFLGARTPVTSLVFSVNRNRPDLVVLSASIVRHERSFADRINAEVVPAVRGVGAKLVVGGREIPSTFGGRLDADLLSDAVTDIAPFSEARSYERV